MWRSAPSAGEMHHRVLLTRVRDDPANVFDLVRSDVDGFSGWAAIRQVAGSIYYGSIQAGDGERVTHEIAMRCRRGRVIGRDWIVTSGKQRYMVRRVYDISPGFIGIDVEEVGHA